MSDSGHGKKREEANTLKLKTKHDLPEKENPPSADITTLFFRSIKKTRLLTADEEKALAWRIRRGDRQARNKLVTKNLGLVVGVAKRYWHGVKHLRILDLIQAGNMGLIKAAERFKPRKGTRFSTYATYWIRQQISREISDHERGIRVPVHSGFVMNQYKKTTIMLQQTLGREPSLEEIAAGMNDLRRGHCRRGKSKRQHSRKKADRTGITIQYLEKNMEIIQSASQGISSLDEAFEGKDGDSDPLIDSVGGEERAPHVLVIAAISRKQFRSVFDEVPLTKREREVLLMRFGFADDKERCLTLGEIGRKWGMTRERIRQIEAKALKKLQHAKHLKRFRDFL